MTIRYADINDYKIIAEYSKKAAQYHVDGRPDILRRAPELSKKDYKSLLKDENHITLVAETDNGIAGCCKAQIFSGGDEVWTPRTCIFIYEIYVEPSFRRNGVAKSLLEEISKIAIKKGATLIELDVWSFNEPALRLYEQLGFRPQKIRLEKPTEIIGG